MLDLDDRLEFIFFGGKGGVGKTTCAAATAVHLARLKPDKRILVVTTDPAKALNRMIDLPLADQATPIEGFCNLWALEIDAKKAYEAYRKEHWYKLVEITYRGGILYDTKDAMGLTRLEAPGVDEVMALKKIVEFHKSKQYDLVVVDTAPTGHTLTLLKLMAKSEKQADMWIDTQWRHRMVRASIVHGHKGHSAFKKSFVKHYIKDDVDRFLDEQKRDARLVRKVLTDVRRTEFVPVTIPEAMGILETYDLIRSLRELQVKNRQIIVNRVNLHAGKSDCGFCHSRREREEKYIEELKERVPHHKIFEMPLFPYEIRGMNRITEYGDILFGKPYEYDPGPIRHVPASPDPGLNPYRLENVEYGLNVLDDNLKFIVFGGKGGVGKTTCAAATAVHLARLKPDKRILVVSADPAHSLSDSLDVPLTDEPTLIGDFTNLWGIELNAEKEWNTWKKDYKKKVDETYDELSRRSRSMRVTYPYERKGLKDQLDLAPSLDEIMAIITIQNLLEKGDFDLIVLDTAPTGHLIRLLEMPEILAELATTLYRFQKKYERVRFQSRSMAILLLELKKKVRDLQELLSDTARTLFVSVTIPEAMGILETHELLKTIKKLEIKCSNIVVNNVNPTNPCAFCMARRTAQLRYVEEYHKEFPGFRTVEIPLFPHEIRGIDDLTQLASILCTNLS